MCTNTDLKISLHICVHEIAIILWKFHISNEFFSYLPLKFYLFLKSRQYFMFFFFISKHFNSFLVFNLCISQKVKGANQVENRFQNHACLFTFYHSQYICLLIYNVQRFKWIIIFEIIFENTLKNYFQTFSSPEVEETISIFNSSQLLLNQRVQRDMKHKASQSVTENIIFYVAQNRN